MTYINSLWPSDAIWRQGSRSTLVQVMACCLTAPSHCLNQSWLIITKVQWCDHLRYHSHQSLKLAWKLFFFCSLKSPRGKWVNSLMYELPVPLPYSMWYLMFLEPKVPCIKNLSPNSPMKFKLHSVINQLMVIRLLQCHDICNCFKL